jgi:two-component system CheB/CheR fusion protein
VEELETTNEELQSSNEEMETMNEELQSANQELETVNEQLQHQTVRLDEVNEFLASVLSSLDRTIIVVDPALHIRVWNRHAEDLWGLRSYEVEGKSLVDLDVGFPIKEIEETIRACLAGQSERVEAMMDATNRRGRNMRLNVVCSPLKADKGPVYGASIQMMEQEAD